MTNYDKAVAALQQATTIEQWNEIRSEVKDTLTVEELQNIDSSGLVVQVLGKDKDYWHYQPKN